MANDDDLPCQEPVAMEDGISGAALPMDMHNLRAPIFSKEEDVEQFTTEW